MQAPEFRRLEPTTAIPQQRPECVEEFGSWMLVRKARKKKSTSNDGSSLEDTSGQKNWDRSQNNNKGPLSNNFQSPPTCESIVMNADKNPQPNNEL